MRKSGFYPVRFIEGGQVFTYFYSDISKSWSSEPSSTDEYLEDSDFAEIGEMIESSAAISKLDSLVESMNVARIVLTGFVIGSIISAVAIWLIYEIWIK